MIRKKVSISLQQVEQEIQTLRARLAEAEAVRNYLRRQAPEPRKPVSEERPPADAPKSQASWATRIDQFLSENQPRRFAISEMKDRLGVLHPELVGNADPASLLRATLNRYASEFGWERERQGRSMLWFKPARSTGAGAKSGVRVLSFLEDPPHGTISGTAGGEGFAMEEEPL